MNTIGYAPDGAKAKILQMCVDRGALTPMEARAAFPELAKRTVYNVLFVLEHNLSLLSRDQLGTFRPTPKALGVSEAELVLPYLGHESVPAGLVWSV